MHVLWSQQCSVVVCVCVHVHAAVGSMPAVCAAAGALFDVQAHMFPRNTGCMVAGRFSQLKPFINMSSAGPPFWRPQL
jgi:hypothetical protein